jgi:hypothetical protein
MFEPLSSNYAIATSTGYSLIEQGFSLLSIDQITPNVLQNQPVIIAGIGDDSLLGLKVNEGLAVSKALLSEFASSPGFRNKVQIAFGDEFDLGIAQGVDQQWASDNFGDLPPIQVVGSAVLGGANGAFSISTNRIYLSREFIGSQGLGAVVSVILEETGHYLDSRINRFDAAGDEGDIFAHLVQGNSLSGGELDSLRQEDDHGFIDVNNQSIAVEFQVKTGQTNSQQFSLWQKPYAESKNRPSSYRNGTP